MPALLMEVGRGEGGDESPRRASLSQSYTLRTMQLMDILEQKLAHEVITLCCMSHQSGKGPSVQVCLVGVHAQARAMAWSRVVLHLANTP